MCLSQAAVCAAQIRLLGNEPCFVFFWKTRTGPREAEGTSCIAATDIEMHILARGIPLLYWIAQRGRVEVRAVSFPSTSPSKLLPHQPTSQLLAPGGQTFVATQVQVQQKVLADLVL
jgi:hypothetical protein